MAQKVMLIDDLDQSEGAETITYSVDGQEYEIDLSEENARKFREALQPYIEVSRQVERQPVSFAGHRSSRRQTSRSGGGRDDIPQIREWAMGRNMDVSRRGRIKQEIIDAYDQANS